MKFSRILVAWFGLLWLGHVFAAPQIVVEPERLDLGRQKERLDRYPLNYKIRNAGDELLKIEKVKPGCGCTQAKLGKNELAPGESTELKAVFVSGSYEGWTGKSIYISSNDPKVPNKIISFRLFVPYLQDGLRLTPKFTEFPARDQNGTFRVNLGVENCDAEGDVLVTRIDLPPGWIPTTKLPLVVKHESRGWIYATKPVTDADRKGFTKLPFTIYTNHPRDTVLRATIGYHPPPKKRPGVNLWPIYRAFPVYKSANGFQVNVAVENGEEIPVNVTKIDLPDDWKSTIMVPKNIPVQGRGWFYFRWEGTGSPPAVEQPFSLHTDNPKFPQLKGVIGKYNGKP